VLLLLVQGGLEEASSKKAGYLFDVHVLILLQRLLTLSRLRSIWLGWWTGFSASSQSNMCEWRTQVRRNFLLAVTVYILLELALCRKEVNKGEQW
jgi:hypothetical protein